MRKNLLSGLILLLPITITVIVVAFLVDLLTAPFLEYMENFFTFIGNMLELNVVHHRTFLVIISRITVLGLLFLLVLVLGFLGNRIFFHWLVKTVHVILMKIPLFNSIYKICRDIIVAILSDKQKLFSRIVTVSFPHKESKAIGLVSGNAPIEVQEKCHELHPEDVVKTVFIPTSPHPISGFLLLVEEKHLKSCDMSMEDAFKFLISCGIFVPTPIEPPKNQKEK